MNIQSQKVEDAGWHLDKRVPIALILAIGLQTSGAIWWAATTGARVTALESWQADNKLVQQRLARMEVRLEYMANTMDRIESQVNVKAEVRR